MKRADPDDLDLEELRRRWEGVALLRTIPWDDFRLLVIEGWDLVLYEPGESPLEKAMEEADRRLLPPAAKCYENPRIQRLVALCAVLQEQSGDRPFFLAGTSVADLLNVSQTYAARWLRLLVRDGVLEIALQGHTGRASEYWFRGGSCDTQSNPNKNGPNAGQTARQPP